MAKQQHNYLKEAEARFKTLGITLHDASVVFPTNPDKFKVFDFESDA
jgi:hypothetical protein